jgi:hypothetical protein
MLLHEKVSDEQYGAFKKRDVFGKPTYRHTSIELEYALTTCPGEGWRAELCVPTKGMVQ